MIGKTIGNHQILEKLGEGGMGIVYKAEQISLTRTVALKILPQKLTRDSSFVQRFLNEARAIAALNHPGIVQIYDVGHEEDTYYYSMEFIDGTSVDSILLEKRKISVDRAVGIVAKIAKALDYMHRRGIIHRDIKPSNIMIDQLGNVKLTDFGLALQERVDRLTIEGGIVGTPEYMSPEQASGKTATPQSDIYSLGVVFYEMLTGAVPFDADTPLAVIKKIQYEEPIPPREINPDIPPGVEGIVLKMMAKDPDKRYSSCRELIGDLKKFKSGESVSSVLPDSFSMRRVAVGIAIFLLLITLLAGGTAYITKTMWTAYAKGPLTGKGEAKQVEKREDTEADRKSEIKSVEQTRDAEQPSAEPAAMAPQVPAATPIQEVTISWNPAGIIYDGNTYFAYGSRLVTTTPANLRAVMREKGDDGLTFSNEELLHQYLPSSRYGISEHPRIIQAGSKYYMYHFDYYIWASGQWAAFVGRLESTDGYRWSNDVSVLKPNDKSSCDGDWEAGQITIQDAIYDNGVYHLWYIGTYRWRCVGSGYYPSLGYAESTDGINFVNRQRIRDEDGNFINKSHNEWNIIRVLKYDNLYYMLYPKDGDIKYRTSKDGVNWQHRGILLDNETVSGLIGGSGDLYPGAIFEDKDGITYLYFAFGDGFFRIRLSLLIEERMGELRKDISAPPGPGKAVETPENEDAPLGLARPEKPLTFRAFGSGKRDSKIITLFLNKEADPKSITHELSTALPKGINVESKVFGKGTKLAAEITISADENKEIGRDVLQAPFERIMRFKSDKAGVEVLPVYVPIRVAFSAK